MVIKSKAEPEGRSITTTTQVAGLGSILGMIIGSIVYLSTIPIIAESISGVYVARLRFPKWYSFKLNHLKYGILKQKKWSMFFSMERIPLKELGWIVIGSFGS